MVSGPLTGVCGDAPILKQVRAMLPSTPDARAGQTGTAPMTAFFTSAAVTAAFGFGFALAVLVHPLI
jgi:hypothetical protein